jgi:hypothetical protein
VIALASNLNLVVQIAVANLFEDTTAFVYRQQNGIQDAVYAFKELAVSPLEMFHVSPFSQKAFAGCIHHPE